MKKILPIIIGIFLILNICNFILFPIASAKNEQNLSDTVNFSRPEIFTKENYISINLDEQTSHLQIPGKPSITIFTKVYKFPSGTEIIDVSVFYSKENSITITKEIEPANEPIPLQNSIYLSQNKIKKVECNYDNIEIYPSNQFEYNIGYGKDGLDHVIFLSVNCYPLRYNPSENIIYFRNNVNINVNIKKPIEKNSYPDVYDLIIIAPEKYSNHIQPLVTHKNNHGLDTQLKTVEDITSSYSGRDDPEKIKYFIKEALDQWGISYVLLFGNVDDVPIRKTAITTWGQMDLITDHYYADIYDPDGFCSWDSNGNDIFGEYNWDEGAIDYVDLYPDVYIGRLPCSTNKEVEAMVNKIITYETETYGKEWFERILYLAGDTFPGHGIYEGEFVTNIISEQMQDFTSTKLWTSTGNYKPSLINQEITEGVGFISYSGHGYEQGFGTSPPNDEQRIEYYTPYLLGMKNGNKYPIIFFDACSTSTIDFRISDLEDWLPGQSLIINFLSNLGIDTSQYFPCFAWFITKIKNAGAIATIGATRIAFTGVSESGVHSGAGFLNVHFYEGYYQGVTVSQMFANAQNEYLNYVGKDCLTIEEFILLGDPSLKVGGYL